MGYFAEILRKLQIWFSLLHIPEQNLTKMWSMSLRILMLELKASKLVKFIALFIRKRTDVQYENWVQAGGYNINQTRSSYCNRVGQRAAQGDQNRSRNIRCIRCRKLWHTKTSFWVPRGPKSSSACPDVKIKLGTMFRLISMDQLVLLPLLKVPLQESQSLKRHVWSKWM